MSGAARLSKPEQAAAVIRDALRAGGWVTARPILDELERRGLGSETNVTRACQAVGVEKRKLRGRLGGGAEWRLASSQPAAPAVCSLCGRELEAGRHRYCDPRCRVEAHRLALIVLGDDRADYPSLAARLAAAGWVRRSTGPAAIERLLEHAGLERRDGDDRQ